MISVVYRCERCGYQDLSDAVEEGDWCPECERGRMRELRRCEGCDEMVFTEDLENDLCYSCQRELVKRFEDVMYNSFRPTEIAWLNDHYEGEFP